MPNPSNQLNASHADEIRELSINK